MNNLCKTALALSLLLCLLMPACSTGSRAASLGLNENLALRGFTLHYPDTWNCIEHKPEIGGAVFSSDQGGNAVLLVSEGEEEKVTEFGMNIALDILLSKYYAVLDQTQGVTSVHSQERISNKDLVIERARVSVVELDTRYSGYVCILYSLIDSSMCMFVVLIPDALESEHHEQVKHMVECLDFTG